MKIKIIKTDSYYNNIQPLSRILSGHFLLDKIISYVKYPHAQEKNRFACGIFVSPNKYHQSCMALRRTHDAIHRQVSKKLAQWGLSVPKYKDLIYFSQEIPRWG